MYTAALYKVTLKCLAEWQFLDNHLLPHLQTLPMLDLITVSVLLHSYHAWSLTNDATLLCRDSRPDLSEWS